MKEYSEILKKEDEKRNRNFKQREDKLKETMKKYDGTVG